MLPQNIIVGIFATLLAQGKITSAIPLEHSQTREERVDGDTERSILSASEHATDSLITVANDKASTGIATSTEKGLIAIRVPVPDGVNAIIEGRAFVSRGEFGVWIKDWAETIGATGFLFVGVPAGLVGVVYRNIPQNRRDAALAWMIWMARCVRDGVCLRNEAGEIEGGPSRHDVELGHIAERRLHDFAVTATDAATDGLGVPPIPENALHILLGVCAP
ncbi:hypothetical protein HYFRA_00013315 [Hymenoscyphus fraxineus]|uniref:Uncharacterized protein n=1 Tax=Hymenoscyphus fraxineus TaxID=746836 RepID=A0A9N9L875_9HELO|nr:hypothetical protein HYFRA_00013315 [Hymenoscyphus fraxineus]